jgi:hypothetical protein
MPLEKDFSLDFLQAVASHFAIEGTRVTINRYGHGHINDTFSLGMNPRYVLQRINTAIFPHPEGVMANILGVTGELKKKIVLEGGDPLRESMTVILTKEGKPLFYDANGGAWRCYLFIDHALSLEAPRSSEDFRQSGFAFGRFAALLSDYPVSSLYVSIPHFHDTPKRFRDFLAAIEKDAAGRAKDVQEEIVFYKDREMKMGHVQKELDTDSLPSRVTHNDTKLNNVLLDEATGKGLCVVDLDTIMPGSVLFDFGDSIRFGANTAVEDEPDVSKVSLSLPLFQAYAEGYLQGFGDSLTAHEKALLPLGAYTMTMECGMRFLTDYLNGDTYFKVAYPTHNLVRAHTQIALAKDMEKKWDAMEKIIEEVH